MLDLTLPVVEEVELETLIEQRTAALVRQLDTSSDMGARSTGVRGQISVQFFEKRRRKAWFTKGEEEVCWEQWTLDVTLATPRTESGNNLRPPLDRTHMLRLSRTRKSSKSDGDYAIEDSYENRLDRKSTQGAHPSDYDKRGQPLPVPDQHQSQR